MEIIIILALAVWLFLALRSMRKKGGCCGDCSKCGQGCNKK